MRVGDVEQSERKWWDLPASVNEDALCDHDTAVVL